MQILKYYIIFLFACRFAIFFSICGERSLCPYLELFFFYIQSWKKKKGGKKKGLTSSSMKKRQNKKNNIPSFFNY